MLETEARGRPESACAGYKRPRGEKTAGGAQRRKERQLGFLALMCVYFTYMVFPLPFMCVLSVLA